MTPPGDPWSEADTEAALEYMEYRSSLCSGCGHPKVESMDPQNEDAYEVVPVTCHACAKRDAEQREVSARLDTAANRDWDGGLDRSAIDGTFLVVTKKGGD